MTTPNQEISLEVAEKNETAANDIKTPALAAPLPPLKQGTQKNADSPDQEEEAPRHQTRNIQPTLIRRCR